MRFVCFWFSSWLVFWVSIQAYSASPVKSQELKPPLLRLDGTVRPLKFAARLAVNPSETTFHGVIDMDLKLQQKTDHVWVHGTELDVIKASFTVDGTPVRAHVLKGNEDFLGFKTDHDLPAGAVQLHVEYRGKISRLDDRGLFSQKEGKNWYAITQMEAIFARRVFPCFDEPGIKVPWQLTLEVPENLQAISNTPVQAETRERPGFKVVTFAETKPLPTYLVAFAVGPYEWVDGGFAGKNKVPIRIAAPAGQGVHGKYAALISGQVLDRLEDYFAMPFPYEKLDNVAIPITSTFGAMENPGMVTFAQDIMLAKPSNAGLRFERGYTMTATHEYAHQWFGDLVTPVFWDDIWLNESFASWMEGKILDTWKPEWTHGASFVEARARALGSDTLVSARKIRQPIESKDDIFNAFDSITYQKGEAVLAMFEAYVGADKFRKGIQAYLQAHAHSNATANDFIASISQAAGFDIAPAFQSFLEQAGAPVLDISLQCVADQPATLTLSQRRFIPLGSRGSEAQTWKLPVCVRWSQQGQTGRACKLITAQQETLTLGKQPGCPQWLLANDQELGYYRTIYPTDLLQKLLGAEGRKLLDLPEMVGVLDNLNALASAGHLSLEELLSLSPALADDQRRHVILEVVSMVSGLQDHVVDPAQRQVYADFIQKLYGAKARSLGWNPQASDDEDTRLIRPVLLSLVADEGADKALQVEAQELAVKWLSNREAISPDVTSAVISIAASSGDQKLFQKFLLEAHRTEDRNDRRRLLVALGAFRDVKSARAALAIVKKGEFDAREAIDILWSMSGRVETRQLAWDFMKSNFDLLLKRLTDEQMASMPFMAVSFCDEPHQTDMEKFFKLRSPKMPGGPRLHAQANEAIDLCRAYLSKQRPSMRSFLAKQIGRIDSK